MNKIIDIQIVGKTAYDFLASSMKWQTGAHSRWPFYGLLDRERKSGELILMFCS